MTVAVLAGRRRGMVPVDPWTTGGCWVRQTITIAITVPVLSAAARRSSMAPFVSSLLAGAAVVLAGPQHAFSTGIVRNRERDKIGEGIINAFDEIIQQFRGVVAEI